MAAIVELKREHFPALSLHLCSDCHGPLKYYHRLEPQPKCLCNAGSTMTMSAPHFIRQVNVLADMIAFKPIAWVTKFDTKAIINN